MDDNRTAVADALGRWAAHEMRYLPQGKFAKTAPPNANDLKSLCRGSSIPFWDYISHRVKSEKTVLQVKQNIEVSKKRREMQSEALKKEERLAKLRQRKEALQAQIASTRDVIGSIHTQTRRTHLDLSAGDRDHAELKRKIEEHDVKVVLLETYEKQLSRTQTILNEYHQRLDAHLMQLIATQTTLEKSHTNEQTSMNDDNIVLKEIYDAICAQLESTASNVSTGCFSLNETIIGSLPSDIQEKLTNLYLHRPYAISRLVSQLADITSDETDQLEKETDKLDLKAIETMALEQLELESLGQASQTAQYGTGAFPRGSLSGSRSPRSRKGASGATFPTVEELLEIQRQEHVARYLASERFLNSAHSLHQQRDQLLESTGRLDSFLREFCEFSGEGAENCHSNSPAAFGVQSTSDGKVSLQNRLQNLELAFCGDEAAYEASCAIVERLSESRRRFERDLGMLKDKFNRIQELDGENKERQLMCNELLRMNGGVKEMFSAQTEALRTFISAKLVDFQREVQASKQDSDDQVLTGTVITQEMAAFHQLAMISPTDSEKELWRTLTPLCEALQLRAHQSMDGLVASVAKSLLEMQAVATAHRKRKTEMDAAVASFAQWNDEQAIQGVKTQVAQLEQAQTEVWIPILENAMGQVSKASERCSTILQLCSDFVQQPAQHFAPWLQVNGNTYAETLKSWKSLAHQLRPQN